MQEIKCCIKCLLSKQLPGGQGPSVSPGMCKKQSTEIYCSLSLQDSEEVKRLWAAVVGAYVGRQAGRAVGRWTALRLGRYCRGLRGPRALRVVKEFGGLAGEALGAWVGEEAVIRWGRVKGRGDN